MKLKRDAVLAALAYCDGHTVWQKQAIIDTGLPKKLIDKVCTIHKSHPANPKEKIYDKQGNVIPALEGVYGLTLVEEICRELKIDTFSHKIGRGTHVSVLRQRIKEHFQGGSA